MIYVFSSTLEDRDLDQWSGSDTNPAAKELLYLTAVPGVHLPSPWTKKLAEATLGCHPLFHASCVSTVTTFCRTSILWPPMPSKAPFPWESGCFLESWHNLAEVSAPVRTRGIPSSFHTWFSTMGVIFFRVPCTLF